MDSNDKKKNGCLIAFLCIIGFFVLGFIFNQFPNGNTIFLIIFLLALVVGMIRLFQVSYKAQVEYEKEKLKTKKKYNATISGQIQHFDGLPIPKGVYVDFYYGKDKITIVKEHQEVSLDLAKVNSIDIVSGNDAQAQATGAMACNLILGGMSGAIIGSLVSTKAYLVISYKSKDENKSIIFDSSGGELISDKLDVIKVVKEFRSKNLPNKEIEKIEL